MPAVLARTLRLTPAPLSITWLLLVCWLFTFIATRLALVVASMSGWIGHVSLMSVLRMFADGLLFDAAFLSYAALPLTALLLLVPSRVWQRRTVPLSLNVGVAVLLFLMLFVAAAEWFFWDEFGTRFNFIAVDYLVYSDEVINNIRESYPLGKILSALAVAAIIITRLLQQPLRAAMHSEPVRSVGERSLLLTALAVPAVLASLLLNQENRSHDPNTYLQELASNGPYQFFAAFRNNTLDYDQFYAGIDNRTAASLLHQELDNPPENYTGTNEFDIHRVIDNPGTPARHNVVVITVESLSAKYLGSFGDPRGLTPNLDRLRQQSLFFNNFYATGTRTDRGLEAVTLSVPPTPGRSIVKRIGHESGYGALGQQLRAQGYDSVFAYGGRGYFDNMNAFFSGNGYRIVDQSSVPESEIHFKNAWGMADEDLLTQAEKVADADYAQQKPFFMHIMTTSNHRPYSYPDGRIDIPSGKGRDGAVKYTDYALGKFLAEAQQKPWFDDTIFVILADHCAGSDGKEDLPVDNYHIPLWIYAPKLIAARESSQLASQIDVAPTVMALLNLDYNSSFFGRNLLEESHAPPRIVIGTYQHLGLFDGKDLAILSPGMRIRKHLDALGSSTETEAGREDPLVQRVIAYYQSASQAYKSHLLAWQTMPAPKHGAIAATDDNDQHHAL